MGNVNRAVDGEALAGAVTGVFSDHKVFTESVTDFYAYLAGVLTRYDLAGGVVFIITSADAMRGLSPRR